MNIDYTISAIIGIALLAIILVLIKNFKAE